MVICSRDCGQLTIEGRERERELGLVSYVGLVGQQGPWGVMLECSTGYCLKQEFTHGWLCGGCLSHIIAHPTHSTHSLTHSLPVAEQAKSHSSGGLNSNGKLPLCGTCR